MSVIDKVIADVCSEVLRAEQKHPCWPDNDFEALAILTEEVGEAAQAMIEEKHYGAPHDDVRKEMIQCAAMAIRWLINDARRDA